MDTALDERNVLDETREFIGRYLVATDAQLDVVALWAASTHAMDESVTHPRLLFAGDEPESGKTTGLQLALDLSNNGFDASGSSAALKAKLAEPGKLTLGYDEISDVFGKSGLAGAGNPIGTLLRKGYKRGATDAWSVNRVNVQFDIFMPFAMTGLRVSVPADIRSRCIVIRMAPAKPAEYYDVRSGEAYSVMMRDSLASQVRRHVKEIGAYRARGLHPKLEGRKLEIWEPLFAIASIGGMRWIKRCMTAFLELALNESDRPILTPEQTILQDLNRALSVLRESPQWAEEEGNAYEVFGSELRDEMRRFGEPLYDDLTDKALAMLIAKTLPNGSHIIERPGTRTRGFLVADIEGEWKRRKPADLDLSEPEEAPDPFEVESFDPVPDTTLAA